MTAESIAKALGGRKAGAAWMARCPAHEDREPSLSIKDRAKGCTQNSSHDPLNGIVTGSASQGRASTGSPALILRRSRQACGPSIHSRKRGRKAQE